MHVISSLRYIKNIKENLEIKIWCSALQSLCTWKQLWPKWLLKATWKQPCQCGLRQSACDRATQVESTTQPSTGSVRKAPPSQSLHSPAQTLPCVAYIRLNRPKKIMTHTEVWVSVLESPGSELERWHRTGETSIFCEYWIAWRIVKHKAHLQMSGTRSIRRLGHKVATLQQSNQKKNWQDKIFPVRQRQARSPSNFASCHFAWLPAEQLMSKGRNTSTGVRRIDVMTIPDKLAKPDIWKVWRLNSLGPSPDSEAEVLGCPAKVLRFETRSSAGAKTNRNAAKSDCIMPLMAHHGGSYRGVFVWVRDTIKHHDFSTCIAGIVLSAHHAFWNPTEDSVMDHIHVPMGLIQLVYIIQARDILKLCRKSPGLWFMSSNTRL